jgi:hypothetical protein
MGLPNQEAVDLMFKVPHARDVNVKDFEVAIQLLDSALTIG